MLALSPLRDVVVLGFCLLQHLGVLILDNPIDSGFLAKLNSHFLGAQSLGNARSWLSL